ncbi:hypothetical protein ACFRI7_07505 [Streptomyces sp. NPDC056716]|uniref:hypothetical protein n=1 Tax=unclassified Streptomyces TaxID=2593676 RepID=UPI00367E0908
MSSHTCSAKASARSLWDFGVLRRLRKWAMEASSLLDGRPTRKISDLPLRSPSIFWDKPRRSRHYLIRCPMLNNSPSYTMG